MIENKEKKKNNTQTEISFKDDLRLQRVQCAGPARTSNPVATIAVGSRVGGWLCGDN